MKIHFALLTLLSCFLLTNCVPNKTIVYLQGNQNATVLAPNYEPIVQQDDMLYIRVSSAVAEGVAPFNLDSPTQNGISNSSFEFQKQSYLVSNSGTIDFPVLGNLQVAGLSVDKVKQLLIEKLMVYVKDPVVNIRLLNFKVSVLGEVTKPGIINVSSQRLTLLEALAQAGDLTLYGKRDNILLIRDFQGTKSYNRIDITKADFVNSPFYYLDQNDVIYVEPRKAKIDSTAIGSNVVTIISILSFLITSTLILTR